MSVKRVRAYGLRSPSVLTAAVALAIAASGASTAEFEERHVGTGNLLARRGARPSRPEPPRQPSRPDSPPEPTIDPGQRPDSPSQPGTLESEAGTRESGPPSSITGYPEAWAGLSANEVRLAEPPPGRALLRAAGREYEISNIYHLADWHRALRERWPPVSHILVRLAPEGGATVGFGEEVFVLLSGGRRSRVFRGRTALRDAATTVEAFWHVQHAGREPPNISMTGNGTTQDFDFALLMLTSRLSTIIPQTLDVHPDLVGLPGINDRPFARALARASIVESSGTFTGTQPLLRGEVSVIGRSRELVAAVMAAIREALARVYPFEKFSVSSDLRLRPDSGGKPQALLQADVNAALDGVIAAAQSVVNQYRANSGATDDKVEINLTLEDQSRSIILGEFLDSERQQRDFAGIRR